MTDLAELPVDPDEGFPQAFLFAFGGLTYGVAWYVNVAESQLPPAQMADPTMIIDVVGDRASSGGQTKTPAPQGILVLTIDRRDADGVTVLLRRRVIPGLTCTAGRLLLVVRSASVALGNLNGTGSFGSVLDVGVGAA